MIRVETKMDGYNLSIEDIFEQLKTSKDGLTEETAQKIRKITGNNTLPKKRVNFYRKYIKPSFNLMIIILLVAAFAQLYMAYIKSLEIPEGSIEPVGFSVDYVSPIIILVILGINLLIAILQQRKVEKTLEALEQLTSFKASSLPCFFK